MMEPGIKELSYVKPPMRFVIRYEVGREKEVLDHLVELVGRNCGFDWFDAAVLSHQLGQQIAQELKAFLPKAKA